MTSTLGNPFVFFTLKPPLGGEHDVRQRYAHEAAKVLYALQEETNFLQRATLYTVLETALDRAIDPRDAVARSAQPRPSAKQTSLGPKFFDFDLEHTGRGKDSRALTQRALTAMSLDQCWNLAPEDIPTSTTLAQTPEALQAALVHSPALRRVVLATAHEARTSDHVRQIVSRLAAAHPLMALVDHMQDHVTAALHLPFLVTRASPVAWIKALDKPGLDGPFVYWNLLRRRVRREHVCPGMTAYDTDGYTSAMSAAYGHVSCALPAQPAAEDLQGSVRENVRMSRRKDRKQKTEVALATSLVLKMPTKQVISDADNAYPHDDRDISLMLLPAETQTELWTQTRRFDGSPLSAAWSPAVVCQNKDDAADGTAVPQLPYGAVSVLVSTAYTAEISRTENNLRLWRQVNAHAAGMYPSIMPEEETTRRPPPAAPVDLALGEAWGWIPNAIQNVSLLRRMRVFQHLEQNEDRLTRSIRPLYNAMQDDGWSPSAAQTPCPLFVSRLKTMLMHTATPGSENYSGVTHEDDRRKNVGQPSPGAEAQANSRLLTHSSGLGPVMPEALLVSPHVASPIPCTTGGVPTDTAAEVDWTAALLLCLVERRLRHMTARQKTMLNSNVTQHKQARGVAASAAACLSMTAREYLVDKALGQ